MLVILRLDAPFVRLSRVDFADRLGVASGVLVDVGCAVANPLAPDVHRDLDVQLDLAHLERRGVMVAHQVANEPPVVAHLLSASAVRHPSSLNHRRIVAHDVNDTDEAMVEDGYTIAGDMVQL